MSDVLSGLLWAGSPGQMSSSRTPRSLSRLGQILGRMESAPAGFRLLDDTFLKVGKALTFPSFVSRYECGLQCPDKYWGIVISLPPVVINTSMGVVACGNKYLHR